MVIIGDTIKLTVQFKNYNNQYTDVENISCKVYKLGTEEVLQTYSIQDNTHTGEGLYECYYTVGGEDFVYEFNGVLDGKTILNRQSIKVGFSN